MLGNVNAVYFVWLPSDRFVSKPPLPDNPTKKVLG